MSALGTAGNVAGLLSLTIQLIGSIKPVLSFFDSWRRDPTEKIRPLDRSQGFLTLLQSSLDRWRQEPPRDTGAIIQTLEQCHREVLRIQNIIGRPRRKLRDPRFLEMATTDAIRNCLEGLQVNLALEHRYVK